MLVNKAMVIALGVQRCLMRGQQNWLPGKQKGEGGNSWDMDVDTDCAPILSACQYLHAELLLMLLEERARGIETEVGINI